MVTNNLILMAGRLTIILLFLFTDTLYSQILIKKGFGELLGNENFPVAEISKSSFNNFCQFLNGAYDLSGEDQCSAEKINTYFRDPRGILFIPSEDDKIANLGLLVCVESSGYLTYIDSDPAHKLTIYKDFKISPFGSVKVSDLDGLTNITSNLAGIVWVLNNRKNSVSRFTHTIVDQANWEHSFIANAEYVFNDRQVIDLFFNDKHTSTINDDELYVLLQNPFSIAVMRPYFSNVDGENVFVYKEIEITGADIRNAYSLCGQYNCAPGSEMVDDNYFYIFHDNNIISKFEYQDGFARVVKKSQIPLAKGNFSGSIRTNNLGELYGISSDGAFIFKFDKELNFLFKEGTRGTNSHTGNIQFSIPRGIAFNGKEIFVTDIYDENSGIQRFNNVAKILDYNMNNLPYNGYNPKNCIQGIRPFPTIKFKLSEGCEIRYKIFERVYDGLDSNTSLSPIWSDTVGTFKSGWNEAPVTWNGLTSEGDTVKGSVVFAITTHKYWDDGDDAKIELLRLDYQPPEIIDSGDVKYNIYTSSLKPFQLDLPLNETAHGFLSIVDLSDQIISQLADSATMDDIARRYSRCNFVWNITGLDSCDAFHAHVVFEDLAGNRSEAPIRIEDITGSDFHNSSGGIIKKSWYVSKNIISPVSTDGAYRFARLGMDSLESYCDAIDSSSTPTDLVVQIYETGDFSTDPVFSGKYVVTGPRFIDWFGINNQNEQLPDGDYFVRISAQNHAGYVVNSEDDATFNNKITLRTAIPTFTFGGNVSNSVFTKNGERYFHVTKNNKIATTVAWQSFQPQDGWVVIELSSDLNGSVIALSDTLPVFGLDSIELPVGNVESMQTGVYELNAWYIDSIGNSGKLNYNTTSIIHNGNNVSKIYIDNSTPSLYVDVVENVYSSPEPITAYLFNNTYGIASQSDYTFTFDCAVQTADGAVVSVYSNDSFPSDTNALQINIPSSVFNDNGQYAIKAVLKDNFGKISDTAFAFFYLNERPLQIGNNIPTSAVSGKIYITGSIGDPDINTTDPDHAFEKYVLLLKEGANQTPATLNIENLILQGWMPSTGSSGDPLIAPFSRQDVKDTLFPWSNTSVVQTNLRGYAAVAYLNSGNLNDTTYTLLALTYEKNNRQPKIGTSNVTIDNSLSGVPLVISDFNIISTPKGIKISSKMNKGSHIVAVVGKFENGEYVRKINEMHTVHSDTSKTNEMYWHYDDALGNKVADGEYRIILAAEEIAGLSYDYVQSNPVIVNTNLFVSDVSLTPQSITYPPDPSTPIEDNIATVSFKSNKFCSAELQISYDGQNYVTVGPVVFDSGGVASSKIINWDGSAPDDIPFSDNGVPYSVQLVVRAIEDSSEQYDTTFSLFRYSQAHEKIGIPQVSLQMQNLDTLYDSEQDVTTQGTSEIVLRTKLTGTQLSTDPVQINGNILVSGKQNVSVWKTASQNNGYEIAVKKIIRKLDNIKIKVNAHYSINYDPDGGLCSWGIMNKDYKDTFTVSLSSSGDTVQTNEYTRSYCFVRDDGSTCESCVSKRKFRLNPEITVENIYSGTDDVANDLSQYVKVSYVSWYKNDSKDGWAKYYLKVCLDPAALHKLQWDSTITNHDSIFPNHYNPQQIDSHYTDFGMALYLAKPEIDYEYEFKKFPENGYFHLNQFPGKYISPSTGMNKLGYRKAFDSTEIYLFTGTLESPTSWSFIGNAPAQMQNGNKFDLSAKAYCNAETTLVLHWPFPKDTVPSLTIDSLPLTLSDGTPYDRIAYKTSDDVDPRRTDSTGGKFDALSGVYQVPDDTMISSVECPQIRDNFSLSLTPNLADPYEIPLIPGIFNPDSYLDNGVQRLIFDSAIAMWDSSALSNPLPPGVTLSYNQATKNLTVYRDYDSLQRNNWTSQNDSLLANAVDGNITGTSSFSKNGYREVSNHIQLRSLYQNEAQLLPNTGSIADLSTYPYAYWRNASGNMVRNAVINYGSGTPLSEYYSDVSGFQNISLHYIDGTPNLDIRIKAIDSSGNDIVTVEHAPLPTPRRFVEIIGNVTYSGVDDTTYSLDYFEQKSKTWNPYGIISKGAQHGIPSRAHNGNRTLGYWDVTQCNGTYVLKLAVTRGDSVEAHYQTINIGKQIKKGVNYPQIVYGPYSKEQILFKSQSQTECPVTIHAIDPIEVSSNINTDIVPVGPLVEILPSGLVFSNPRPVISFNLTYHDIDSMGIPFNQLGLINLYYVDEERGGLVPMETGVSRFLIRGTDTLRIDSDTTIHDSMEIGNIAVIEGVLEHTSIYGFFNSAGNFTLDHLTEFVNVPYIRGVKGTGPAGENVTVYVSSDSVFDRTEPAYSTTVDPDKNWYIDSTGLVVSGRNYIFAVTQVDGHERMLQTIVTLDNVSPVLSGDFEKIYISSKTDLLYSFNVQSSEPGIILVSNLNQNNSPEQEFPLTKIAEDIYSTQVPALVKSDDQYMTILSVRAVDYFGNASEPKFKKIILDNEKPRTVNSSITQASLKIYNYYLHLTDNENLARFCIDIYNSKKQLIQTESCSAITGQDTACNVLITIDSEYVEQPLISIIRVEDMAGNQTIMEQPFGGEGTEDYSQWHDSIDIPIWNLEISEAVMNFPLLIKLDGSNFQFSQVQADAHDIRFAKSDGTKLPFEVELWDSIAKEAYIWVRIPNLSPNNDETIRMYWRNPSADKLTNSWRVWFDDYLAVYHITNVVQDTIADSTISDSTGLLSQYAVFATNKVKIGNNSTIFGNIGSNVLVENGIESVIDGDITAKDSVALMDRCIVNGSVFSGGGIYQSAGITVKNDLVENAIIPNITIPRMDFNIGVIDSMVGNNQICYLNPGVYRKLSLHDNSELHFEAGTYVFDEIETGTDVRLVFDIDSAGKTNIKIKSMIGFNDRCKMVFSGDSLPSNVSIYSNQASVLRMGPEAVISGVITAPNAEIQIYSQVKIFGALRTEKVTILEPDVQIYRRTPPPVFIREIISDATAYKQHAINQKAYRENGVIAKSISLDGKKSFLECPSQVIDSSVHEFSLTMLVKAANDSFGGSLVSQFDSGAGWHFGVSDSMRLIFKSFATCSNSATNVWDTLWHQVAATYDDSIMRLYIDTLLVYENSCKINSTNAKTLIGKFLDTLYFNGIADEIRFSRKALSYSYLKLSYINQIGIKNIVQIIPSKPVIALNSKDDNAIHLAVQQVGKYVDRIEFQKSINGTVWEDIGSVPYPLSAFIDTAITCGLNYSYRAKAVYGESNSEWSDIMSVTSNLCPVEVEVLSSTNTKIEFKSLPFNSNVTIERKSNNDSLWGMVTNIPARDSIYIDNSLECENTYIYRLKYAIGNLTSEYMGEDTVTTKLCPPTNLQAKTIDSARVLLSWNHIKDVNAHFEVQVKEHNDTIFGASTTIPGDCISFTINNLSCETAYDFRVCFVNSNESSEWAYLHNIQTGYCNNRPSEPESLSIESVNNNYKLTWHDNSNNEDFFIVYRSESKDPYSQDHFKIIGLVPSDTCNFIDMQFPCNMFLKYKVASANTSNGGGASAPTNIVQVHSAPCIKNGSELFPLNCVLVDNNGSPINANNAILTIRLYPDTLTNELVCTETFTTDIINGYVNVNIGMSGDTYNIIKNDSTLYYEIFLNNVLIPERKPVLAVSSSIVNRMVKTGTQNPIGNVMGEIGSLYLNITNQELYFKFGTAINDWKKVE